MTQQEMNAYMDDLAALNSTAPIAAPQPEKKIPHIARCLTSHTLGLLKLGPKNPQVRALVQAELKVPLPDEVDTWEKIVEWGETKVNEIKPTLAAPRKDFAIQVCRTVRESGRCSFTRSRSYHGGFGIVREKFAAMLADSNSIGDLCERLSDHIMNELPGCMSTGNARFFDYEADPDDEEVEEDDTSPEMLQGRVINWLATNLPEEYERLTR